MSRSRILTFSAKVSQGEKLVKKPIKNDENFASFEVLREREIDLEKKLSTFT